MMDKLWTAVSLMKRMYDTVMQPLCGCYGISRMEMDVLLFLANNPQFDTARDIVERRKLTKSHVSASVGDLVERGFLEPSFKGGNKKTIHLKLHPSSGEIVRKGQKAQKVFLDTLLSDFTPEEMQIMGAFMDRISGNIRSALPGGGSEFRLRDSSSGTESPNSC